MAVTVAACSSSQEVSTGASGQVSSNPVPGSIAPTSDLPATTTAEGQGEATTTTSVDGVLEPPVGSSTSLASAVPLPLPVATVGLDSVETQVFWVRMPGDERTVDLPGYQDPPSGPLPLLLYGSATNVGSEPVRNPLVTVTWLDASGSVRYAYSVPLLAPGTTQPMTVLDGGGLGDVIVVIDDPATIAALGDLAAELAVTAGG